MRFVRSLDGLQLEPKGAMAMELRMQVDDAFIGSLQRKLDLRAATEIVRAALTILNWAVDERERGRVIVSADPSGQSVVRLAIPVLDRIGAAL
jgi:hypothetical protein